MKRGGDPCDFRGQEVGDEDAVEGSCSLGSMHRKKSFLMVGVVEPLSPQFHQKVGGLAAWRESFVAGKG